MNYDLKQLNEHGVAEYIHTYIYIYVHICIYIHTYTLYIYIYNSPGSLGFWSQNQAVFLFLHRRTGDKPDQGAPRRMEHPVTPLRLGP